MGERFLIDTNAAIDYLAGRLPENGTRKIERILTDKVGIISIIVKIELLSFNPPNSEDLQIIEALINQSIQLNKFRRSYCKKNIFT